jgi:hypothetical protein
VHRGPAVRRQQRAALACFDDDVGGTGFRKSIVDLGDLDGVVLTEAIEAQGRTAEAEAMRLEHGIEVDADDEDCS